MGWRRRTRARPSRCDRKAFNAAVAKGPAAVATYVKVCGGPLGRVRKKK